MPISVIVVVFLAIASILMLIGSLLLRARSEELIVKRRLEEFSRAEAPRPSELPFILRDERLSGIDAFDKLLKKLNWHYRAENLLKQADIKMTVGKFVLIRLVLAGLGVLLTMKMNNIFLRLLIPLAMFWVPVFYAQFTRSNRLKSFIREFPDAIDMLTSSLRAGQAFNRALQLVAEEAPAPVGSEFRKTFEDYNLGLELKEALLNLADRVNSSDLRLFVTAVLLQRETGGNLTEMLEKIGTTIRERFKLMGQLRTYTAQGRMSALILGSMPIVFMLLISVISPDYLKPLFDSTGGKILLVFSFILQIFGFIFIRKIVHVKYQ